MRKFAQIDVQMLMPAQNREQIGVGDREVIADQELPLGERVVDVAQAHLERLQRHGARVCGSLGIEQRADGLVQLGADVGQPLAHAVVIQRAEAMQSAAGWAAVHRCRPAAPSLR
jgi:hypothetical protein